MIRNSSSLFVCLLLLVPAVTAGATEVITYNDRTAKLPRAKIEGVIQEETPAGIKVQLHRDHTIKTIPAADVVEIEYEVPPEVPRIDFHRPFNMESTALKIPKAAERRDKVEDAARAYKKLAEQIKEGRPVRRYLLFRAAALMAHQAEEDRAVLDTAINLLARYRSENGESWEVLPCTQMLAQLYEMRGSLAEAEEAYRNLTARTDLPAETRQQVELALVGLMIRNTKYREAEGKIAELAKAIPADDPAAGRLQVELGVCLAATDRAAEAEKVLLTALAGPTDGPSKALACNTLGEAFEKAGKKEEAFWRYLWVDVLYNQDPAEHARALYHLSKLFVSVRGDAKRAEQCKRQLLEDARFTGLEYQKRAAAEK